MRYATKTGRYNHYHLLSGQDLPIQEQKTIQDFFTNNSDKEFVGFDNETFEFEDRVHYRCIFQELAGRRIKILKSFDKVLLGIQKFLNIKRNQDISFQKGAQWFSITDDFARYVIGKEPWIRKMFNYGCCVDEVFLQTVMLNSGYIDHLYHREFDNDPHAIMRFIDWERGQPYTFRNSDFDELCESEMFFARKFDAAVDSEIIKLIKNKFSRK